MSPTPAESAAAGFSEPRVGCPERFDGDPTQVRAYLTNCCLVFSLQPRNFATEAAKVAYAINHLSGRARLWGTAEFERQSPACSSFSQFADEMVKVFDTGSSSAEASRAYQSTALKARFTSAPILRMPDPDRQLVVEVDAFDVGFAEERIGSSVWLFNVWSPLHSSACLALLFLSVVLSGTSSVFLSMSVACLSKTLISIPPFFLSFPPFHLQPFFLHSSSSVDPLNPPV
ncbi:hypothetical protein ACEWY4_021486 [Coilia grayii]|uniref:DUF4939 domain-containing protein n=1 Tax=Coilia grayii TaxID=363190 RepID=A0ABD1J960_9TELE